MNDDEAVDIEDVPLTDMVSGCDAAKTKASGLPQMRMNVRAEDSNEFGHGCDRQRFRQGLAVTRAMRHDMASMIATRRRGFRRWLDGLR